MDAILFNGGGDVGQVIDATRQRAKSKVYDLPADYLLQVEESSLSASIASELYLDVPTLKRDDIYIADQREANVDVSHDPNRFISDRSRPLYLKGQQVVIAVPFDGDGGFFSIRPMRYNFNPPRATVSGTELTFTHQAVTLDATQLKADYEATVNSIDQWLTWHRDAVAAINGELETLVAQNIKQRKADILAGQKAVTELGLPIRRRDDAPQTYTVPVKRNRPVVERPKADSARALEPVLAESEYQHILQIIQGMVSVMEQSPKAFSALGEEDLRTHFLVQLNGQYQGSATGETFNYQGKTDILIKEGPKNIFIAECKFWSGEKALLETIDQLLSYLGWRDTKAALILFNRNKGFSAVLKTIEASVPLHPHYLESLGSHHDGTSFKYQFKSPHDKDQRITLTVMAFDVPQKR